MLQSDRDRAASELDVVGSGVGVSGSFNEVMSSPTPIHRWKGRRRLRIGTERSRGYPRAERLWPLLGSSAQIIGARHRGARVCGVGVSAIERFRLFAAAFIRRRSRLDSFRKRVTG